MSFNNFPPEFYDQLKIAGQDKYNEELNKLKQQAISNIQQKQKIKNLEEVSRHLEAISKELNKQQKEQIKNNRKNKIFNLITFILTTLIGLGTLAVSIASLFH